MDNCNCIPLFPEFTGEGGGGDYPQFGPGYNWTIYTSMEFSFVFFDELTLFGSQIAMGQPSEQFGSCPNFDCDIIS